MNFLTKFVYSSLSTAIIAGGGVGISLSSNKQFNSVVEVNQLRRVSDQKEQNLVSSFVENSGIREDNVSIRDSRINELTYQETKPNETLALSFESKKIDLPDNPEVKITQKEEEIGNCTLVENPREVINKLPESTTYFSVSCENSEFSIMDVEKWIGIFSSDLLKDEGQEFKLGNKFNIDVEDQEIPESYTGPEGYQTLFKGEKFFKSPLIGRWGDSTLENEDEEETFVAYKVELVDIESPQNFYIFKPTK